MTSQLELDRVLGAFLATGTDELADRVIDAALDQIDHTPQRHALRLPRRFPTMTLYTRLAAAAVIGVIAVGGAFFLWKPSQQTVGTPSPSPAISVRPSAAAAAPTATPLPLLTGPMGAGRQVHSAALLADGRVLLVGGFDGHDGALASGSIYDPVARTFTTTGPMGAARGQFTLTLLSNGHVLAAGGGIVSWTAPKDTSFLASAELFDPASGAFSPTGAMSTPREGHTATKLNDGRVLIVGGIDRPDHALASAELYDPKTGLFSATGPMTHARAFHTATLLFSGRVLIAGGTDGTWSDNAGQSSTEIYDPATGTFSPGGQMTTARAWHTATLLPDLRVLIVGPGQTAELYDETKNAFTETGKMHDSRIYQAASLIAGGYVLVVGGGGDYANANFLASAEIWTRAGTFAATGTMAATRTYLTATELADGRVLVAGGYSATGPLPTGEIFDPATGTFSPAS